ncbi:MAG: hypothetical protein ACM31D_14300 [Bacteroidota bacterium]
MPRPKTPINAGLHFRARNAIGRFRFANPAIAAGGDYFEIITAPPVSETEVPISVLLLIACALISKHRDRVKQCPQARSIRNQSIKRGQCGRSHSTIDGRDAAWGNTLNRLLNNPRPITRTEAEKDIRQSGRRLSAADPIKGFMAADRAHGLVEIVTIDGCALLGIEVTRSVGAIQARNPRAGMIQCSLQDATGGGTARITGIGALPMP